jgi:tRNA threonylcarbamoyladenosine biosynthesis protein TsaE
MVTFTSRSPEETQALGESWGKSAFSGQIIGLTGDLGAGKTQLVKGLARGLGVKSEVHSPSFALVHEYADGRLPLFHIDLYRLQSLSQIIGAGLEEYFYHPPGVTIIEWVERWNPSPASVLQPYRHVAIQTLSDVERRITYEDFGA